MNDADFHQLLDACKTLNDKQKDILRSLLCEQLQQPCQLYQQLEQNFTARPIAIAMMFKNVVVKATASAAFTYRMLLKVLPNSC